MIAASSARSCSSCGPIASASPTATGSAAPTCGSRCSTTQRSTRASRSSDRRKTSVCTSISAALRNSASSVLSKAICRADVTLVRLPMNPSRSLTIGRTRLMFISALEIPSTVPMKPMTGRR